MQLFKTIFVSSNDSEALNQKKFIFLQEIKLIKIRFYNQSHKKYMTQDCK